MGPQAATEIAIETATETAIETATAIGTVTATATAETDPVGQKSHYVKARTWICGKFASRFSGSKEEQTRFILREIKW